VAGRIAGPQHGVVARRQLLREGLTSSAIEHMVAAGRLLPLYRGVYAVGHRPVGPRSRELAVVLLAGPRGALGRESSAGLWSMTRPWRGPVHVLGPKSRNGPGFVIHRTRHLPPEDVTVHWGIPVTTPLRTLLDLSSTLPLDALDAALAEALVRRLVTVEALQPRATGKLNRLLETAAPTRSRLERDLRTLLREHGLPQPISNGIVCGYEVDLHWPEQRLVAELDGYEFHAHRRAFETDRERDIVLAAAGWRTVRVTDRQLTVTRAETAERFTLLLARGLGRRDHFDDRRHRASSVCNTAAGG
jgi:very-short-patch-repair endonuclease